MTKPKIPRQHEVAMDALAYWQCVCITRPNGWGMHIDPEFGVSHSLLNAMERRHGPMRFNRALDVLFGYKDVASKPGP
jgi:hypothetical protein